MERELKQFSLAVEAFVNAKKQNELKAVFQWLPDNRQDYHIRFDEMFINSDDHLFFILATNLAEWISEIQDKYANTPLVLDDFWELFEFIDDEITEDEQQEVIQKAQGYLVEFKKV